MEWFIKAVRLINTDRDRSLVFYLDSGGGIVILCITTYSCTKTAVPLYQSLWFRGGCSILLIHWEPCFATATNQFESWRPLSRNVTARWILKLTDRWNGWNFIYTTQEKIIDDSIQSAPTKNKYFLQLPTLTYFLAYI